MVMSFCVRRLPLWEVSRSVRTSVHVPEFFTYVKLLPGYDQGTRGLHL